MSESLGRVLVVDDDEAFRFALRKALRREGFEVTEAGSGEDALRALAASPPDAALLDLRMRGMDGLEVLRRRPSGPTRFVVLTGHGTVQAAVEAMRLGAYSFLEKPVDAEELGPLLRQAIGEARKPASSSDDLPPLIGQSLAMGQIRHFLATVGPTDATVTIFGETGTGKEVVARHLHAASRRAKKPFVALNAATVPRELFESELFGHRKGSFTGATSDRKGLFREADGGTLFIDELGELPIESQAKLLRAIEVRKVRAVGEGQETDVDVRIVAATNRDLWGEVLTGRFREDLYFRLQVFPVVLAPLRERRDDIAPLAEHLIERLGMSHVIVDESAQRAFERYDWPGNVRELLNVLRRSALFAQEREITGAAPGAEPGAPTDAQRDAPRLGSQKVIDGDLARRMIAASVFGHAGPTSARRDPSAAPAASSASTTALGAAELPSLTTSLAEVERAHIERVLAAHEGNITKAAIALGIDRRTLQRKLKGFGFEES